MNPMEPYEPMPEPKTEPPRPLPAFVFVDLRQDPEAWAQIENELPEGMRYPSN